MSTDCDKICIKTPFHPWSAGQLPVIFKRLDRAVQSASHQIFLSGKIIFLFCIYSREKNENQSLSLTHTHTHTTYYNFPRFFLNKTLIWRLAWYFSIDWEALGQKWTERHVCTNTVPANSSQWGSIQTVEQTPQKRLLEAILTKTLKDRWKKLSRLPHEYSDLPNFSLLPVNESVDSGCLKADAHQRCGYILLFFFSVRKAKNSEPAAERLWEAKTHWRIPADVRK